MLRDCVEKDPAISELIVLRMGHFARVAKAERCRFTQALLTLWPLGVDVDKASLDEILDDRGVKGDIAALGVGFQWDNHYDSDETFRLDLLRYGKIVLAVDDGPRGRSASKRFLSFMARHMRPLLAAGHVYVLSEPLRPGMTEASFVDAVLNRNARSLARVGTDGRLVSP